MPAVFLMPHRRDAFLAAAEVALAVEAAALATGSIDTVATTGVCNVFPGAVNSIPSRVSLEVDVRDTDLARRDSVLQEIAGIASGIAMKRRVAIENEILNADRARGLRCTDCGFLDPKLPGARPDISFHGEPRISRFTCSCRESAR